jgi:CheY-like chemotaxis protein
LSGHILVVEDDQVLRESLCDALVMEGYRVVGVEDGAAALSHLRASAEPPCLILLDLMMPVMDGWALRKATLAEPALATIPVVVMTAAAAPQFSAPPEVARVLHKPLHMDLVVDAVQAHCPGHST